MTKHRNPGRSSGTTAGANRQSAWRYLLRIAPWLLAGIVIALVVRQAVGLDWPAVRLALAGLPWPILGGATAVAFAGHAAFASYDLVARRVVGHHASVQRSALIGAIGYALNLNFGALIGGVAVRLRLYQRAGVPLPQAGAVVAGGMLANWCGWAALLAGALLLAAIAGVITHVPAGLGVLEAVLLSTLGGLVAPSTLLAALLAYRAVYYVLPLAAALVGYLVLEVIPGRAATTRHGCTDGAAAPSITGRTPGVQVQR